MEVLAIDFALVPTFFVPSEFIIDYDILNYNYIIIISLILTKIKIYIYSRFISAYQSRL